MKRKGSKVKLGTLVKSRRGQRGQAGRVIDLRLLILIMEEMIRFLKIKAVKLILNKIVQLLIQRLLNHLSMTL